MDAAMKGPITSADCRKHIEEILDKLDARPGIKGTILFYFDCGVTSVKKEERKDVLNTLIERFSAKASESSAPCQVATDAFCGVRH